MNEVIYECLFHTKLYFLLLDQEKTLKKEKEEKTLSQVIRRWRGF